jgi:hypothetical protein
MGQWKHTQTQIATNLCKSHLSLALFAPLLLSLLPIVSNFGSSFSATKSEERRANANPQNRDLRGLERSRESPLSTDRQA